MSRTELLMALSVLKTTNFCLEFLLVAAALFRPFELFQLDLILYLVLEDDFLITFMMTMMFRMKMEILNMKMIINKIEFSEMFITFIEDKVGTKNSLKLQQL